MKARRMRPGASAFVDWLARNRGLLAALLTTVVATAFGYWWEGALLDDLTTGAWALLALGLAAGLCLALLWASIRWSSAARGCFIHVVAENPGRLDRHSAEHTVLESWASEVWPDAPVLPFRPLIGGDEILQPAAEQIVRQLRIAQVLVPSSQQVTLLPGGPAHRIALLGAAVGPHIDQERLRLLSDSNKNDKTPFLEFTLPAQLTAAQTNRSRGTTALLIRGGATNEADVEALHLERPPIAIGETGLIPDTREHYVQLIESIDRALGSVETDTVLILSAGPSSLTFAAGYLAARHGLTVRSTMHVLGEGYREPALCQPAVRLVIDPAPDQARASRKWWWALGLSSLALGLAVPTLSIGLALALEWLVGHSQQERSLPFMPLAIIAACATALVIFGYRMGRDRIEAPTISIVLDPRPNHQFARLRERRLSACAGGSLEQVAKAIRDVYCDAVATLPSATQYVVDLSATPTAAAASRIVTDPRWGLDRTLRGREPIRVSWRGQRATCGPRETPPSGEEPSPFTHQAVGTESD